MTDAEREHQRQIEALLADFEADVAAILAGVASMQKQAAGDAELAAVRLPLTCLDTFAGQMDRKLQEVRSAFEQLRAHANLLAGARAMTEAQGAVKH